MIDNSKEYILCAAYKQKKNTANRQKHIDEGYDVAEIYHQPHRDIFNMRLGWRHPDILYQYKDEVDRSDTGGFCTSKGRYVTREEAYKIAVECGQIVEGKFSKSILFSEDLY